MGLREERILGFRYCGPGGERVRRQRTPLVVETWASMLTGPPHVAQNYFIAIT